VNYGVIELLVYSMGMVKAVSSTSQAEPSQGLRLGLSAKDRGPAWLGWLVYQISIQSAKNTDTSY
jgi:hypothetical protein